MRRITVYSTLGSNEKVINSSARTLRELHKDLDENGVSYRGMKLVVGETQVTLESAEASLPEGEFTLFLTAQKVKSGYEMIDEYDGITWNEVDWTDENESIVDYTFKTKKDLAIAKLKKAAALINSASDTLGTIESSKESNKRSSLAVMARQIEDNLNEF